MKTAGRNRHRAVEIRPAVYMPSFFTVKSIPCGIRDTGMTGIMIIVTFPVGTYALFTIICLSLLKNVKNIRIIIVGITALTENFTGEILVPLNICVSGSDRGLTPVIKVEVGHRRNCSSQHLRKSIITLTKNRKILFEVINSSTNRFVEKLEEHGLNRTAPKKVHNGADQELTHVLDFVADVTGRGRAVRVLEGISVLPLTEHVGFIARFVGRSCNRFKEGSEVVGNKHLIEILNRLVHEVTDFIKLKVRSLLQLDVVYELLNFGIVKLTYDGFPTVSRGTGGFLL